jgi:hypothetical protein
MRLNRSAAESQRWHHCSPMVARLARATRRDDFVMEWPLDTRVMLIRGPLRVFLITDVLELERGRSRGVS